MGNEHAQHRKRMKNRFLKHGLDSYEEHQILEMLLFFGIPRVDTNETAHKLIKRFGSLRGVLDAPYEELVKTDGIGENCATLIKFSQALARKYNVSSCAAFERFDSTEKISDLLISLLSGYENEVVYMLCFNGRMELINCTKMCEGTVSSTSCDPRALLQTMVNSKAEAVVVAHNHPNGFAIPSGEDIHFTRQLKYLCDLMKIKLIGHFIVAGNTCAPVIKQFKGLLSDSTAFEEDMLETENLFQ